MYKKGFTLVEVLAIIVLLGVLYLISLPIINGIMDSVNENNRKHALTEYAKEVNRVYMLTIAEDNFYSFDSYENGGITTNNIINFTNEWLLENLFVNTSFINENDLETSSSVNCKGIVLTENTDFNTLSKVYLDIAKNSVDLIDCTVDGIGGYHYKNGQVYNINE